MSWFKRKVKEIKAEVPTSPYDYPSGVCVKTESGLYYLKNKTKYRIKSDKVFKSWKFPVVIDSSDHAISHYRPSLRRLGFRDGTIVRDIYDQRLYIISNSERVSITTPEAYAVLAIDDSVIPYVSHEDVVFHKEGGSI